MGGEISTAGSQFCNRMHHNSKGAHVRVMAVTWRERMRGETSADHRSSGIECHRNSKGFRMRVVARQCWQRTGVKDRLQGSVLQSNATQLEGLACDYWP